MKYLMLFCLATTSALANDKLGDFHQDLMRNFDRDVKNDNELRVKKDRGPARGPASVVPENRPIQEENKIDKNVRQTGHRAW